MLPILTFLFDKIFINENTFNVHTSIDRRVITGLKYPNQYGCNANSKSDHEITYVYDFVYKRVILHKCPGSYRDHRFSKS